MGIYKGTTFLGGIYKNNEYIGEVYKGDSHIASMGFPKTVSGTSPLTLSDARAKALTQYKLNGESKRTITIDGVEYVVPDGYTLLEYIQSSGTQYIDTNVIPTGSTGIKMRISVPQFYGGSDKVICGSANGSDRVRNSQFTLDLWNSGVYCPFGTWAATTHKLIVANDADTVYNFELNYLNSGYVRRDSTEGAIPTYSGTWTSPSIYLCAANCNGTVSSSSGNLPIKLYRAELTDANNLVRNFIPAKNSSNVLGMYDLVSGQFFTNAGTGTFTAGPELPMPTNPLGVKGVGNSGLPDGYKKLEYIESSGTQYITTSFVMNTATDTLQVKYENLGTTNYKWGFGTYTNSITGDSIGVSTGSNLTTDNLYYNGSRSISSSYLTGVHTFLADSNGVSIDGTNVQSFINFTTTSYLSLFCFESGQNKGTYRIYSYIHTRDGNELIHLIPAKNSSDVIGMYDTVTNTFFTNAGTGNFIAGPEDTSCVVPILQAQNCGMVDMGTLNWTYRGDLAVGEFSCANPVLPAQKAIGKTNLYTYGYTTIDSSGTGMGDKTICGHTSSLVIYIRDTRYTDAATFKAAMSGKYLYYQRTTDAEWQSPTTYTAYLDKPLLKVGTYVDSFDFASGVHTENVGVKVFNGEESFTGSGILDKCWTWTTRLDANTTFTDRTVLCTHFKHSSTLPAGTARQGYALLGKVTGDGNHPVGKYVGFGATTDYPTESKFKAFLAAQYAAGTPVTVYYPLATPATSQHTAVPVVTAKGTNYIEAETEVKPSSMVVSYISKTS